MMWPRPIFAQHVFHRHRHVVEVDGGGGAALDAHLLFFGAGADAGKAALDQKRRELLAVDFREDGEEIGRAAVGDPHLLAVEDVVLSRPGSRSARVRAASASDPACGFAQA